MRLGFTIIYNGAHHLLHNDWINKLPKMLDHWVIIEGAAHPGGSTSWCNELKSNKSTDNTVELLEEIEYYSSNVTTVTGRPQGWKSKDEMVNAAIMLLNNVCEGSRCVNKFLWQLDIDEQWTVEQMEQAEIDLFRDGARCGCFHANYFVGPDLLARGTWGEGNDPKDPLINAYRRLWRWNGRPFKTHEPPELEGGNGNEILLPQRFNHYSYMFEQDIVFKSKYYKGYEKLHEKWLSLQKETVFPQPLSRLIDGHWGETKTVIEKLY
jgi:hypothetical protein